jgi:hypothetical protein
VVDGFVLRKKCYLFYLDRTGPTKRRYNLRGNITRSAYSTPIHNNSNNGRRRILIKADLVSKHDLEYRRANFVFFYTLESLATINGDVSLEAWLIDASW